jgi:type II secretory pathway pseudopilin PulG
MIELLVVIGIIVGLIALVLTVIPKVRRAVAIAQTQTQIAALASAIQQYYADFHAYPGPLANNQLYYTYDQYNQPQVQVNGKTLFLTGSAPFTTPGTTQYNPSTTDSFSTNISSSQNLVLGLLGGLELQYPNVLTGSPVFVYNPQDIFSLEGTILTPAPKGPASLNPAIPRRQQAYIQIKNGDLSLPSTTYGSLAGGGGIGIGGFGSASGASFADSAGRSPQDAMIPVFLDKFSEPLPILYLRANVGGTAIVGYRSVNPGGQYVEEPGSSTVLQDSFAVANNLPAPPEVPQYDLTGIYPYVFSSIGLVRNAIHGLKGVTASSNEPNQLLISAKPSNPTVDSIDTTSSGLSVPTNAGKNGLAYFKDPSLNSATWDGTTGTTHAGAARQKDGYILISAGPDGQYGTHDDIIYPGPLQP